MLMQRNSQSAGHQLCITDQWFILVALGKLHSLWHKAIPVAEVELIGE